MSKNEFIDRLAQLLADIPPEERDEALTYYREYIEDAGLENEEAIMQELGSPEEIAAAIKGDSDYRSSRQPIAPIADTPQYASQAQSNQQTHAKGTDSTVIILAVILAVVLISLFIAAIVCLFRTTLLIAFSLLGAGLLVAAIGILFIVLGVWLCATVIPLCATGIGKVFHKLFSRNKEAQA